MTVIKRYWIIILISILLVGGFASTLLFSYLVAYRSLKQEVREIALPLTGNNVYSEIQKDLIRSIHISSQMAEDTFIKDWLLDGERDPSQMIRYLSAIQNKYHTITAFFVSEKTRKYYHPTGVIKTVSIEDPQDAWYFRARAMDTPYEINIDTDTADRSRITIFINYQVRGYNNELVGLTGVGLELKQVQSILANYKERYKSDVFFLDRKGAVVVSAKGFSLPENLNDWEPLVRITNVLTNPQTSFEYRIGGHLYFVNSRYIPELNLILMVVRNSDLLEEQFTKRMQLNFLIGLSITTVVVSIVALILRKYHQSLEHIANIDTLTGIYNRSAFSILFSHAVKDSKRRNVPLSLALIDLDNFKKINDKFGHHGGDIVLQRFVNIMLKTLRSSDVLCRWGGEEFLVLLKDTPLVGAAKAISKIREAVLKENFYINGDEVRVTFSAGVVEHQNNESLSELVMRADKLMYEAKRQGKDRILHCL
ncbi:MAG: GGDEF domain-containing protein [Syntrophobacterales bacterium]|nr:GGDEF domain-containing protein [Syntrophobacterales bacterium]